MKWKRNKKAQQEARSNNKSQDVNICHNTNQEPLSSINKSVSTIDDLRKNSYEYENVINDTQEALYRPYIT